MAKILSQGITLSIKEGLGGDYTVIPGLLEVPDIGGTTEKIDVTTLADTSRQYINGIKDYGELTFKFVYDGLCCKNGSDDVSNYQFLYSIFDQSATANEPKQWKIEYNGTPTRKFSFTFSGYGSLSMDAVSVNSALTFTLTIALASDITYAGDIAG